MRKSGSPLRVGGVSAAAAEEEEEEDGAYEAVGVNQRHLIDKILARYATEYTLFRELCQNADDARATCMKIEFTSEGNDETSTRAAGSGGSSSSAVSGSDGSRRRSSSSSSAVATTTTKKKKRGGIWGLIKSALGAVDQLSAPAGENETGHSQQNKQEDDVFYTRVAVKNDGAAFTDADWNRVKNIASGNPDESKVGEYSRFFVLFWYFQVFDFFA